MEYPLATAMSFDRVVFQLSLLKDQLEMAERYFRHIAHLEGCASTQYSQLEGEMKMQAQKEYEILHAEYFRAEKTLYDLQCSYSKMSAKPSSAARPMSPKTWHVSDFAHYCTSGAWALEAVSSGSYAAAFPALSLRERMYGRKYHGGPATEASNLLYMSVGDILFMADTVRGKLFRGVVSCTYLKGEDGLSQLRSSDTTVSMFRKRVEALETVLGKESPMRVLTEENEIQVGVNWSEVSCADLNPYLRHEMCPVKEIAASAAAAGEEE